MLLPGSPAEALLQGLCSKPAEEKEKDGKGQIANLPTENSSARHGTKRRGCYLSNRFLSVVPSAKTSKSTAVEMPSTVPWSVCCQML